MENNIQENNSSKSNQTKRTPKLTIVALVYNLEKEEGTLEFIFQIKGEGTRLLSKKQEGDLIDIVGPLGMGTFKLNNYQNIAVIGGGIGVFPLYELSKEANKENRNVNIYLGFRDKENVLLEDEFKNVSKKLVITTDNGTYGIKGFAIEELEKDLSNIDCVYACRTTSYA